MVIIDEVCADKICSFHSCCLVGLFSKYSGMSLIIHNLGTKKKKKK